MTINPIEGSIAFRSLAFGYANARVKAMRQSLFTERELKAMATAKSLEEVYAILEKTQYREDLQSASNSFSGKKPIADIIELALTRNFSRVLGKINKVSPEFIRDRVSGFFERYDANNAKIILLGKHLGQTQEEIRAYIVQGGAISRGTIERATAAKSLKDAVYEFAGTEYASAIGAAHIEYERTKEISKILEAIDNVYYSRLPELAKQSFGDAHMLLKILKSQIDSKNVSNILRAKKAAMKEEKISELIIGGGSISKERLRQAAAAKSVEDAARIFHKDFDFTKALEDYKKNASLIPFELQMEKEAGMRALSLLRSSVLSIGTIIGFALLKEQEIANIRKVVRAKEFGLSNEALAQMLVAA